MDVSTNAKVSCLDGPCGQSTHVILKPTTKSITHVVVNDEMFLGTEHLVSVNHIVESTPDMIRLNCSRDEVSKMPIFNQFEFVPSDLSGFTGSPYMMWPFYTPGGSFFTLEKEHVPANELAIRRGASVEATDGPIGRVDEFLINSTNDHITHLVMREGHLWGKREVTIPMSQIDHYKENTVYLKLNKKQIEELPSIPIQHNWSING